MTKQAYAAAAKIKAIINNDEPKLGMILGSGLSSLCEEMEVLHRIPYSEIDGFHQCSIAGHSGELVFAKMQGVPVLCMCGRPHHYEGVSADIFKTMIRTLKLLDCRGLVITNAAGSLKAEAGPGSLMMIDDHINFQATNPLFDSFTDEDLEFGPRFLSMDEVYDKELRTCLREHAEKLDLPFYSGVYIGTQGPLFETPAEIRAYRIWGADAVGMSTIPDVVVAHHCGIKILTLSIITNAAAGMSETILSHDVTINGAKLGAEHAKTLLRASIKDVYNKCLS